MKIGWRKIQATKCFLFQMVPIKALYDYRVWTVLQACITDIFRLFEPSKVCAVLPMLLHLALVFPIFSKQSYYFLSVTLLFQACLKRSFDADVLTCPTCRSPIEKALLKKKNDSLQESLNLLFPGYSAAR